MSAVNAIVSPQIVVDATCEVTQTPRMFIAYWCAFVSSFNPITSDEFYVIIPPLCLSTEECPLIEIVIIRIISLVFQTLLFGLTIVRLLSTAHEHALGSCRSMWNMSSIIRQFLRDGTWAFVLIFGAHLVLPALRDT